MIQIPPRPPWPLTYHIDFREEAAHDFSVTSTFVDSKGVTWTAENVANRGSGTFGVVAETGLRLPGSASRNYSGSTRDCALVRADVHAMGWTSRFQLAHWAMELELTLGTTTAGLVILEASAGNYSRNYLGDVGGTERVSVHVGVGGTNTANATVLDPSGGHPAVGRLESFSGLGGDCDFWGDGAVVVGRPDAYKTLNGLHAMTQVTPPFGWDRDAGFLYAPGGGRLLFGTANAAVMVVRQIWLSVCDLSARR